jgi:hypothetical protein
MEDVKYAGDNGADPGKNPTVPDETPNEVSAPAVF